MPYGYDRLDEIVYLMLETVCIRRKTISIAGDDYAVEHFKAKFMSWTARISVLSVIVCGRTQRKSATSSSIYRRCCSTLCICSLCIFLIKSGRRCSLSPDENMNAKLPPIRNGFSAAFQMLFRAFTLRHVDWDWWRGNCQARCLHQGEGCKEILQRHWIRLCAFC